MKKSLLALAVLGAFAGVASAQSSVTIYGVVDQGVQKSNGGSAFSNGPGTSKAWTLAQSTTSRLGFRGNEDLGGGLSAQFWIEHRFNPDTGAQNQAPFWNGRSFVQLTSATAGSIYLGRDYTPAFWVQLKSDPFGNDGVGQFGTAITWAGYYTPDQASGVTTSPQATWPAGGSARASNSVGYKTPNWGGFTAQVAVSASETTGQGRGTGLNAEYTAGPLYVGLAGERVYGSGTSEGRSLINAAVHYNFGVIKPIVYFAKAKTGPGAGEDNKTLLLAATAPLGNGVVKFGVSKTDFEFGQDYKKLGLGYNYFLSKRTNIYADLGVSKGRISSAVGTRDIEGSRNTSYALGVRHTF